MKNLMDKEKSMDEEKKKEIERIRAMKAQIPIDQIPSVHFYRETDGTATVAYFYTLGDQYERVIKDKMLEEMFEKGYMYCKKHDTFYPVIYAGCPVCQLLGGVELVFENLEQDLKSGTNVLKEWKKTRFGDV